MLASIASEEFIGRFLVAYKDGKTIYAYDELTQGLYSFSFGLKEVKLVLSPESIRQNHPNRIVGIAKSGNEIVLIPDYLDTEWIFFDVKKKKVRFDRPVDERICISGTITIGTNLVFIPGDLYNPIIIFSFEKMKITGIYEKWYENEKYKCKEDKEDNGISGLVWGASAYEELVVFPIVDFKDIGLINGEDVKTIRLDIPTPVLSVSVYRDRIWVLPIAGQYIYALNFKGNIVNKIDLSQNVSEIKASDFLRIVATEENIFLFPVYGKNLFVYRYRENQIVEMKRQKKYLRGRLYEENLTPYWGYMIEDGMLHILPCDYHYKEINLSSLDSNEYSLKYGENINHDSYWKMMGNIQKKNVLEKREYDLDDFFQYTDYLYKRQSDGENRKIGTKIWSIVTGGR